jgi:formylglycine-generating enzyme required for sulfatase activity
MQLAAQCSPKRYTLWLGVIVLVLGLLLAGCGQDPTPTAEPTPEAVAEATATDVPPTATTESTDTTEPEATETAEPTETLEPTETPRPTPRPRPTIPAQIVDDSGAEMALVEGGFYEIGFETALFVEECRKFQDECPEQLFASAAPEHVAVLEPFYIDLYEVSNQAFADFLNDLGGHEGTCLERDCLVISLSDVDLMPSGEYRVNEALVDHPASRVTWYGAAAYCEWRGGRLPTEAEWEVAAGWNPEEQSRTIYPWGDTFDGELLNFCDESCQEPQASSDYDDGFAQGAPVDSFADGRSPIGLFNMVGNVWEWMADWYDSRYYTQPRTVNPQGPPTGQTKVVRGGSWFDTPIVTNVYFRAGVAPTESDETIGFRCARDVR